MLRETIICINSRILKVILKVNYSPEVNGIGITLFKLFLLSNAIAAFTLATAAAAANYEVELFFTFWGLNIIRKNPGRSLTGRGIRAKVFNFLMGGLKHLPLSRFNFAGASPKLMTGMMKAKNVATLPELIQSAKDLGVKFVACEMAMHILEIRKEDLIDEVKEIVGATTFLERARGGETLFI